MKTSIGFIAQNTVTNKPETVIGPTLQTPPRRSIVQVYFPNRGMSLSYYNDQFDLHCGDLVYVDGKLEGMRGRVTEVSYNFKIKVSDYKRVVSVVDTSVSGQFFMAGTHFVTFDRGALPFEKARSWFKAPLKEEDEIVSGSDDTRFKLEGLDGMKISPMVAERGRDYFVENRVKYVSLDGTKGYAIVEGSTAYEVEFEYDNGEISGLTCSCFCSQSCKHEVAAMLELRERLSKINEYYMEEYEKSGYFAAIDKDVLFLFAIDSREIGSITL